MNKKILLIILVLGISLGVILAYTADDYNNVELVLDETENYVADDYDSVDLILDLGEEVSPTFKIETIYPVENISVDRYGFFNVTFNVTCLTGTCGVVNVTLDPLVIGTSAGFVTSAPTGDPTGGTFVTSDNAGTAFNVTSPSDAIKITEIGWYTGTATQESDFRVGLYNSNGAIVPGEAGTRIYLSGDQAKGTDAGWKRITGLDWAINGDTNYWLAMGLDNTATTTTIDREGSGGPGADSQFAKEALPDPFGGGSIFDSDGIVALYAVYSTGAENTSKNGIIPTDAGIPFYTNKSTNPYETASLSAGQSETMIFYVNATGGLNENYTFFGYGNVTSNLSISNETDIWLVNIVAAAPPADTCTYTSGIWNADCSDFCNITSNVVIDGSDINIVGDGEFTTTANITGYGDVFTSGGGGHCMVTCLKGSCFR